MFKALLDRIELLRRKGSVPSGTHDTVRMSCPHDKGELNTNR